jgi:hypothetical protein
LVEITLMLELLQQIERRPWIVTVFAVLFLGGYIALVLVQAPK